MNRQLFHAMVAQYGTKTITGTDGVKWSGGVKACYLPSLKFYGRCSWSRTPAPEAPVDIYDHIGVYKVNSSQDYLALPNLRSVGSKSVGGIIADEWDYVTGKGIRRIKKIVLDGETNKITTATTNYGAFIVNEPLLKGGHYGVNSTHFKPMWNANHGSIYAMNATTVALCRQFNVVTNRLDDWNSWLKAQYAAGTPVVVYYAVAEPIPFEERVQPYQPIPNYSGQIQFVDGNVSGAPFEITYITHS